MLSTIDGIAMLTVGRSSRAMESLRRAFTGLFPLVVARSRPGYPSVGRLGCRFTPRSGLICGPLEFTLRGPVISDCSAHRPLARFEHLRPLEGSRVQLGDE